MFSGNSAALVVGNKQSKKQNKQGAIARALQTSLESLEGRVLLSYGLDPSFSGDGMLTGAGGGGILVQADNKIIAPVNGHKGMTRINTDGTVDTSFGGGTVTTPFSVGKIRLSGGKLIVSGYNPNTEKSVLARYNLNGTLDTTFGGGDGMVDVPFNGELEIAPDGKLVEIGERLEPVEGSPDAEPQHFVDVAKFTADGVLDTSFSGDGLYEFGFGSTPGGFIDGIVQSNGKIIGTYYFLYSPNEGYEYHSFRLTADGTEDAFAGPYADDRSGPHGNITTLAVMPDDRFLAGNAGRVQRYSADGILDTTFNSNALGFNQGDYDATGEIYGLLPLADGKTLVTGLTGNFYTQPDSKAFVARLLSNGNADTTFSPTGIVFVDQHPYTAAWVPRIDSVGRVIVGGSTPTDSMTGDMLWIARLTDLPQSPYHGDPFNVGQTIQAEDFDTGGEGVAYHDSDATNNGGAYRAFEGVDIESAEQESLGGFDVGWTNPGEWIEYSINIPSTGNYTIDTRLSSPKTGGKFHYEIDGVNASGPITIPNTGSFKTFTTITNNLGTLSAGTHVLRLAIDAGPNPGGQANFNWIKITAGSTGGGGGGAGAGLVGEYFNNMDFTAQVLTRNDPNINFNWGAGSPDPRIDPDTFSVIWSGAIQVPTTGRYTFYTTTDDGVRLTIASQNIIDHLTPQAPTEWSGSIDLVAGQKYDFHMAYFERAGGAQAKLSWSGPGIAKQIVPASAFSSGTGGTQDTQAPSAVPNFRATHTGDEEITVEWDAATDNVGVAGYEVRLDMGGGWTALPADARSYTWRNLSSNYTHTAEIRAFDAAANRGPISTIHPKTTGSNIGNGLEGQYFNNMDFTGLVFSRTNEVINYNWGTGSPGPGVDPDTFSVRWTGQILAPTTGRYAFYTTTDDGARLIINGQKIIDKMVPQSATEWSGTIDLVAGQYYSIQMDYFDRAGGAQAKLQWSGPGISKQVVPQSALFLH